MLSPLPTTNPATTERSSFYSGSVSCAVFQSKRKKQCGARTDHSQQQEIKMGFDNTNTGVLFKNTDRQSEQSPNYRGSLDVNGESFWLNAWLKTSKKGERYMSLSIKPKNSDAAQPKKSVSDDFGDSSIPF